MREKWEFDEKDCTLEVGFMDGASQHWLCGAILDHAKHSTHYPPALSDLPPTDLFSVSQTENYAVKGKTYSRM
jgi:hypothetical protein